MQIRLLEKTIRENLNLERLRLIKEKDLKKIIKKSKT